MKKEDYKNYNLPEASGVYFFLDKKHVSKAIPKKENVLYIGKATNLKDRVKSYFSKDLEKGRGIKIISMIENAKDIFYIETNSVLEAIILESKYIKEYQPFFNTKEKDNKSYSYIIFTDEKYPKVLIARGREIEKDNQLKILKKFGPFVSRAELLEVMKFIRKIFPYRDKCKLNEKRGCFNYQIGLCPGVCIGKIGEKEYSKILKNTGNILSGNFKNLLKDLEKEMNFLAREKKFEEASSIRDKINAFLYIKDINFIKNNNLENKEISDKRIESYDISHISGKNRVGVMIVFEEGGFKKNEYRKFKIKEGINDDLSGLVEILERRFSHKEWKYPDILLIDGGKVHLEYISNKLKTMLNKEELRKIKLFSVVKNEKHKAREVLSLRAVDKSINNDLIIKINEETHRFAISYHKALRNKIKKVM